MTTVATSANDLYVESLEERRAARTIKLFILLGWMTETFFLFFGMVMFPQLSSPVDPSLDMDANPMRHRHGRGSRGYRIPGLVAFQAG